MRIFVTSNASAASFRQSLLSCVAKSVLVPQSGREFVARELDALDREPLRGSWSERQALRATASFCVDREYASSLTRLNAAYYAKRAVTETSLVATFLRLVIENLRLERESELDVLFSCFPMLEVLNAAEHAALLKGAVDALASVHERRLTIHTNANILDQSAHHHAAMEVGQQCAAWFTLRDDLSAAITRLEF